MSVPCRNWNSKGKHWCWLLGEMTGFLLHSWGLRTLSDCHILGCVLAALAPGDGKPCWAGNLLWCWFRKADGEDTRRCLYFDIWSKMSPGRELLYFFHNFSYKWPAWRRAWKMQSHGLFHSWLCTASSLWPLRKNRALVYYFPAHSQGKLVSWNLDPCRRKV